MSSTLPQLILLPGLAGNADLWRETLAVLPAKWRATVGTAHQRHATLPEMAATLLAEHPGEVVLCGTSMGGMLAIEAWRQAPERIRGLALLGSSARPDTPSLIKLRENAIQRFAQGELREVITGNVPFAFDESRLNDAKLTTRYVEQVVGEGADQLIRQNRAVMARVNSRPDLPHIQCPALILCGENDQLTPLDHSQEMARAIPHAQLHVLPRCGHMLTLEQPLLVGGLLLEWLKRLEKELR
ncbi:MAG: 2-hydroxy-6-oxononadienedioate/2-hydroxy-6-oxononatrienedioate hydrolase [Paracidovorax wautersii]|uniref:2-hydroxy-6-oxononadienedioate/2-hydroxy-6-oxononatrienedioate hydrolase n=1 Tax=Paracidovorax wautersii TaxID=1177982 RepID=A0A7V8FPA9_9BURK|nr:MAG: 2-hydroxy-6-oxononadienedioate/2-hydroxy-6-oxononatrienedioate hydrolase [Paracidovorax wautersii]